MLLFLHEGASGRDRVGRSYYLQAMDMCRRLGFDQYKSRPYDCEQSDMARQSWRATTVAVWGVFCVEKCAVLDLSSFPLCRTNLSDSSRYSFMSFLTGFEPTLPPPSIEKYFDFFAADERTDLDSRDGDWSPYPMQRPEQQALLGQSLSALCSLGQIYHEISAWDNKRPDHAPLGSQPDIAFRMHMFQNLATWDAQLHLGLRASAHSMAHSYYLELVRFLLPHSKQLLAPACVSTMLIYLLLL